MDPCKGTTGFSSASPQLLRLYRTSRSSRRFESTFERFYKSDEYEKITDGLRGPELENFIDFLDELLKDEKTNRSLFQQALHALWSICGKRGLLPRSYIIPEGVLRRDERAFASGGFADVRKGELVEKNFNRRKVCLKTIKVTVRDGEKVREDNEKAFYEEVSLWMRLKHPNVVRCFGATTHPHQIVIDWMGNGEVMDYVRNNPNVRRTHLALCVARGLDYLHSCGVVHGDVKPPNILVNAEGDACLTDFGLSVVVCNKNSCGGEDRRARGHSSVWVAPETLNEGRISKEVDVFCYSLVALEIFRGESPWGQATAREIMVNITLGKRPHRPEGAESLGLTTRVWNCLTECWNQNPEERMTISEVLSVLLNSTTGEGSGTVHASDLLGRGTTGSTTIRARRATNAPQRASGSKAYNHQRLDSHVPSRPGLAGLEPSHHYRCVTGLYAATDGIEIEPSSLVNNVAVGSRPNPAPPTKEGLPTGLKRFLRRFMTFVRFRVPPLPELCPPCASNINTLT